MSAHAAPRRSTANLRLCSMHQNLWTNWLHFVNSFISLSTKWFLEIWEPHTKLAIKITHSWICVYTPHKSRFFSINLNVSLHIVFQGLRMCGPRKNGIGSRLLGCDRHHWCSVRESPFCGKSLIFFGENRPKPWIDLLPKPWLSHSQKGRPNPWHQHSRRLEFRLEPEKQKLPKWPRKGQVNDLQMGYIYIYISYIFHICVKLP